MTVTESKACRACGARFSGKILLDLGEQEIVDFLEPGETGRGSAPLQLVYCEKCGLVQMRTTVDQDTLYRKFWYRSSINEQMRVALKDVVISAVKHVDLKEGDFVCDIGSNDGELLLNYPADWVKKVGFEPARDLAVEATGRFQARKDNSFEMVGNYFRPVAALGASGGSLYKIVTAIAMFYDLDDPLEFLYGVQEILSHDGVFIIQMNYLGLMVRNLAFDNISHEHLCYYSLSVLQKMLDTAGLGIFAVEFNAVNGGSVRVYTTHKKRALLLEEDSVRETLMMESTLLPHAALLHFANRIDGAMSTLLDFLKTLKSSGKKVYAYGASTRGMTLLQTLFRHEGNATDYIVAAAERDRRKFGKRMAGVNIPIVSEEEARRNADYMLVLPYHFWPSIQLREREWMQAGGKFILPVPTPKVVRLENIGLVSVDLEQALEPA